MVLVLVLMQVLVVALRVVMVLALGPGLVLVLEEVAEEDLQQYSEPGPHGSLVSDGLGRKAQLHLQLRPRRCSLGTAERSRYPDEPDGGSWRDLLGRATL